MSKTTDISHNKAFAEVAELLRGAYKRSEYWRVILPFTVLRRLDCVLKSSEDVSGLAIGGADYRDRGSPGFSWQERYSLFNTSKYSFASLVADHDNLPAALRDYVAGFPRFARDVFDKFNFDYQITRLASHKLLYPVVSQFARLDLSPDVISDLEMGITYESLILYFSDETTGEHFTPREVIRLMVSLLFVEDQSSLTKPETAKTVFDPACGTGGMLFVSQEYLHNLNPQAQFAVFGQELNSETFATCQAHMLITGQDVSRIRMGDSFDNDQYSGQRFDYLLTNPPFSVNWKGVAESVRFEHQTKGYGGRFGAGLPPLHDSSFLFLQHMISKMKSPEEGGSRLGILFDHSPLSAGSAGTGASEIRRWIIESDWLDAVVALPDQLFYDTGIPTYYWVLTNRKNQRRLGKIQLIDARESWSKTAQILGKKRKQFSSEQIAEITSLYNGFEEGPRSKIVSNSDCGFISVSIERPLRLRWVITDDTLTAIAAENAITMLPTEHRQQLIAELQVHRGAIFPCEGAASRFVQDKLQPFIGDAEPRLVRTITASLAVRDPKAPPVMGRAEHPEPDPALREERKIPLPATLVTFEADISARLNTFEYQTTIGKYLDDEVRPAFPDAWIHPTKTTTGYEIPFPRYFPSSAAPGLPDDEASEGRADGHRQVAFQRESPITDLLGPDGETPYLEYKSTLRWDIRTKKNPGPSRTRP